MGPWHFVGDRLVAARAATASSSAEVTRAESGSPATGSHAVHAQEQDDLLDRAFEGLSKA